MGKKLLLFILAVLIIIQFSSCNKESDEISREKVDVTNLDNNVHSKTKNDSNSKEVTEKESETKVSTKSDENSFKNTNENPNKEEDLREVERNREKAKLLNTKGFILYEEKKYEEALQYFEKAFIADDTYYLAHYNYACTVGVLLKQNRMIWSRYIQSAIEHLSKVLELNPDYISKMESDPDLEIIRKEYDYLIMLGLSPNEDEDIKEILIRMNWYIPHSGIFGNIGSVNFTENNKVILSYDPIERFNFENQSKTEASGYKYTGTYTIENNEIIIKLDEKMLKKRTEEDIVTNDSEYDDIQVIKGVLNENGIITFDVFEYPLVNFWNSGI